MAITSVNNLFKQRKFPFIFSIIALLLFVLFFLVTNSQSPLNFTSDFTVSQSPLSPLPEFIQISSTRSVPDESPISELVPISSPRTEPDNSVRKIEAVDLGMDWKICGGYHATDYIPCLDNLKVIKGLRSRRHMEHRERYCPNPSPRCLIPLPRGYKIPIPWPKSRDMIWFDNVPQPKLIDYKKDQNWVLKKDNYLVFPGGGTQFKDGVHYYIHYIEKTLPSIEWGKKTRVVLDVGCGVASFGGYLLDKGVITMSFAPKDEHTAQIQFALERGIPATLSVIGSKRLPFPDNAFDVIHCARCRVHWDANGGKPLMELNRIVRPGGLFIWSATPVYRRDKRDKQVWNCTITVWPVHDFLWPSQTMVALTKAMCWKVVAKDFYETAKVGLVIYQKPISSSCYEGRKTTEPPICDPNTRPNTSWNVQLDSCLLQLPRSNRGGSNLWPTPWPKRLKIQPLTLSTEGEAFYEDTRHWSALAVDVYIGGLNINWSTVRNVMDMNAGFGGFAAALIDLPLWVMNVVPVLGSDTLPAIFDRGLIGIYHDWCESFNTYPRSYDLLHSSFLFGNLTHRCDIIDVAVEMDRIVRPNGYILIQDAIETINKLGQIFGSLHWSTSIHHDRFLVGKKTFWRPKAKMRI